MGRKWTEEERKLRSVAFATPPRCPQCGEIEPTKFYVHKRNGRRSNAYCSECHKKRCRQRYQSKTIIQRRAEKASAYGLSAESYLKLYSEQGGRCAICGEIPSTKRGIHIDHCHETNVVRGLLCHGCNIGIGNFKHRADLMKSAIEYLGG